MLQVNEWTNNTEHDWQPNNESTYCPYAHVILKHWLFW